MFGSGRAAGSLAASTLALLALVTTTAQTQYKPQQETSKLIDQRLYLAVIYPLSDVGVQKSVNRTLSGVSSAVVPLFSGLGPQQSADVPGGGAAFSRPGLEALCRRWEGRQVVAALVLADRRHHFETKLAAAVSGVPLLWAAQSAFAQESLGPLEVRLDAGVVEAVAALRALLISAHWHSYTLLYSTAGASFLGRHLESLLKAPPLSATIVPIRIGRPEQNNRVLARVSQSTKGVIVTVTDWRGMVELMAEAKRLNMVDGNFVWIWVDTSGPGAGLALATPPQPLQPLQPLQPPLQPQGPQQEARPSRSLRKRKRDQPTPVITSLPRLPIGLLALRRWSSGGGGGGGKWDQRHAVRSAVRVTAEAIKRAAATVIGRISTDALTPRQWNGPTSCWNPAPPANITLQLVKELRRGVAEALGGRSWANDTAGYGSTKGGLVSRFTVLNLVPEPHQQQYGQHPQPSHPQHRGQHVVQESTNWKTVGEVVGCCDVKLERIIWPGGGIGVFNWWVLQKDGKLHVPISAQYREYPQSLKLKMASKRRNMFYQNRKQETTEIGGPCGGGRTLVKVVTAVAAPFVMHSELGVGEPNQPSGHPNHGPQPSSACLRGLPCHLMREYNGTRYTYQMSCCYGLAMDLLETVAQELEFDFHLYMVPDSMFGSRIVDPDLGTTKWNGVVGELVSGAAHMAFTALSVSRPRSEVVDFSTPFYFSGVSFLAAPNQRTEIPLLAFLLPFSPELWIAIFTSLNVTAVAVAIYEWLSPFGLNPWGRQRTKNFSMSSALWVCWGLLCGHLVAFKAPKSWPNKFLINVWGGFSVIFVASYTANIAALIAGLFFHSATATYHDNSLLWQRVGAPKASAADYYVHRANQLLWEHMQRHAVTDVATGVQYLKNGTLDILIADTPILDYYRATDQGCKLQKIGDAINEDTYAIGMTKGFPLKDSVSAVISKLTSNGYMDILQEKWYGGLACFKADMDMSQPKPLGVTAVAGVFLLLGLGVIMGLLILLIEHLFYRYTLPILRHKPKGTIWKSRNIMFFSQKLYRFINCVELVSPHHAARELVHTIRQGQITSLFQKSVKRKEHEQRRRRKSKAQFFEMIQEIRRVQQEEKQQQSLSLFNEDKNRLSPRGSKQSRAKSPTSNVFSPPQQQRRMSKLPSRLEIARRLSKDVFRSKSSGNLSVRRLSSDINIAANRFFECHSSQAIGRRLSRDTNPSPPDMNSRRASHFLTPQTSFSSELGVAAGHRNSAIELHLQPPKQQPLGSSAVSLAAPLASSASPGLQYHTLPHLPPRSPVRPQPPPPEISIHPPAPTPPPSASAATKRFSYIDVQNPTFRDKLSRFNSEDNKVIVHHAQEPAQAEDSAAVEERRKNAPTLLEQINSMQEQFPVTKPKIVSCVPKRLKTRSASEPDRSPLERLSKEELVGLCSMPEEELKKRLMDAIKEKEPT